MGSGLFYIDKIFCFRFFWFFDVLIYKNKKVVYFFIIYGVDVIFVGYNECFEEISCVCLLVIKVLSFLVDILKNGGDLNDVYVIMGKFVL